MEIARSGANESLVPELYFLIAKFLAASPLEETAKVLIKELVEKKVLPKRIDWLGNEHEQTFDEVVKKYPHIGSNHLLEICARLGPILDKELAPSVPGIHTLLGCGRQNLLRTKDTVYRPRTLVDYCTRLHGASLPDSATTKPIHNLQKVIFGRETGGIVARRLLVPTSLYNKTRLLRRTLGHLNAVYCVLFDRTGRYIITGADDLLVKIWSALDGRLLATLRGASAEISDIAINLDNTMIAAGSCDKIIRVWDLQTTSPIAVLTGHTSSITSVNFCPSPSKDLKYLVTTSNDGSIAFWQYSTPRGQKTIFAQKPHQYHEKMRPGQSQMICTTFSPGGIFLAAGSADHHVRVYMMQEEGPKRILETEAYTDAVDSVQWSHRGLRFISGSKDGTAHIWTFESQQWKSVKLCMTERLRSCPPAEDGKKLKVTMVAWDASDDYVMTAVSDFTIKIWNSKTAKLHQVLNGHTDEVYVLESNPKDKHVLLSAGHDGKLFLWDIEHGTKIASYINDAEEHGYSSVFDAKWSPDGTMFAATDLHGRLLMYGLGMGVEKYEKLPTELFFHTDYRPLLSDAQHHVVDEQTQIMPHLMPPPILVDSEGNPHPSKYQRFVPGCENITSDQLLPNTGGAVTESPAGSANESANFSHIDAMIAAIINDHGGHGHDAAVGNEHQGQALRQPHDARLSRRSNSSASALGGGNRLVEMPFARRQSASWGRQSEQQAAQSQNVLTPSKYLRRTYLRPMTYSQLYGYKQSVAAAGQFELQEYKREMRRRPIMIQTGGPATASQTGPGRLRNLRGGESNRAVRRRNANNERQQPAYRTRAVRGQERIDSPEPSLRNADEEDEASTNSSDTSFSNADGNSDDSSEDSDSESSEYSDWVADTPNQTLEPPTRSRRRPVRRQPASEDTSDDNLQNVRGENTASTPRRPARRNKRITIPTLGPNGEIPELYRPSEWLSEIIPRKTPYYPQMGDEVIYFRQGHQRYIDMVRERKFYKLPDDIEPWNYRNATLDHELVRVIGIKYEIRPPRLCCLKLAVIDEDGKMTGTEFKIKYHDIPDVIDFLVLRQMYDLALQRNWNVGDRFRCMIADAWWMGQIESRQPNSLRFNSSHFMCFRVRWDNGEYENMSPWDMEPIDEHRLPDEEGGAVPVLPEEIRATLYQPKSEEWHRGDRDGSCRQIVRGLESLMRLSVAENFLAPVDLNTYPDYAYIVEYPIDLTTIKSRFENHFYRRLAAAQFDVRYLATNAEKYNIENAGIARNARVVSDLCLQIMCPNFSDSSDLSALYRRTDSIYNNPDQDNDSDVVHSTSTAGPSTSRAAAAARLRNTSARRSSRIHSNGDWRSECRELLDSLCENPDSLPFREPVDAIEFPDYLEIIATPMDLRTVKEDLRGGNYDDPLDFARDVRLIFQNSKNYNTNKRSQIFAMTLRLSAFFESHIKTIVASWKSASARANKKSRSTRRRAADHRQLQNETTPPPSTRRRQRRQNNTTEAASSSVILSMGETSNSRGSQRLARRRNANTLRDSEANVVSSSSAPNRRSTTARRAAANSNSESSESEEENASEEEATSDSSSDDDDNIEADELSTTPVPRAKRRRIAAKSHDSDNQSHDSEESYNPLNERASNKRVKCRSGSKRKSKKKSKKPNHRDQDGGKCLAVRRRNGNTTTNATEEPVDLNPRSSRRTRKFITSSEEISNPTAVSQNDESSRDAPASNRRGARAAKNRRAVSDLTESPCHNTRNQLANGSNSNDGRRRIPNSTISDHSYHLPPRNSRIIESDTDSPDVGGRPTRQSAKRALIEWANGSGIEDEESSVPSVSSAVLLDPLLSDDLPTTSRAAAAAAAARLKRGEQSKKTEHTKRNGLLHASNEDEDNDRDSDDEPLANSQPKNHAIVGSSLLTARTHMTRSYVTSNVATSSNNHIDESPTNSCREPSSAAQLSQSQADQISDLDYCIDPLDQISLFDSPFPSQSAISLHALTTDYSRRLRKRPTAELTRSEEDSVKDNSSKSSEDGEESIRQDEASDSDDNQPLTSYVASANIARIAGDNSPKTSSRGRPLRIRENAFSENDDNGDDDDSNDEDFNEQVVSQSPYSSAKKRNARDLRSRRNPGNRNKKRPRYNEQSEDDDDLCTSAKRLRNGGATNMRWQRKLILDDEDDDEDSLASNEQIVSVSSRGRVRKISARAKRIFRE